MSTTLVSIPNWVQQAKLKIASTAPAQDDKAITEAFAQQAYTAVGNRDREIMRDPYLLGFEIVTKNEENTRLVGVFAFRVSGEILLVPVFYLNGQIKGQDLLYRKGVNRFCPNTDKWVAYLLARGEDTEGRGVRRDGQNARINLNFGQLSGQALGFKSAAADMIVEMWKEACADSTDSTETYVCEFGKQASESHGVNIKELWKQAMDTQMAAEPEPVFARMLIEQGMQKQAAELIKRYPEFGEMIEVGKLLAPSKQAAVEGWDKAIQPEAVIPAPVPDGFPQWMKITSGTGIGLANPNLFKEWLGDKQQFRTWQYDANGNPSGGAPSSPTLPQVKGAAKYEVNEDGNCTSCGHAPKDCDCIEKPEMQDVLKQAALRPDKMERLRDRRGECQTCGQPNQEGKICDCPPEKQASLVLHRTPAPGWDETRLEAFYKRGFSLIDEREKRELSSSFTESPMSETRTTVCQPGVQKVTDGDGTTCKALWAPLIDDFADYPCGSIGGYEGTNEPDYLLVLLDGKDKGSAIRYSHHSGRGQLPVFEDDDTETDTDKKELKGAAKPKAGKTYTLWFPSLQKAWGAPFTVRSISTTGDLTKINFDTEQGGDAKLVIRQDLEESNLKDFAGDNNLPRVVGKDVVWVELEAEIEYASSQPRTPKNICWARLVPPASFRPLTADRMTNAMLQTKSARVEIIPDTRGNNFDVLYNGQTKCQDLGHLELVCKLARDLRLPAREAEEWADMARTSCKPVRFGVVSYSQKQKLAKAYLGDLRIEREAREFDAFIKTAAGAKDLLLKALEGAKNFGRGAKNFGDEALEVAEQYPAQAAAATGVVGAGLGASAVAGYQAGANGVKPEIEALRAKILAGLEAQNTAPAAGETAASPAQPGISDKVMNFLKNPWVLGGLAAGTGAAAYGAYRQNQKKKKVEPTEEDKAVDKAAATYYDRDIDPEADFADYEEDQDLGIPMDLGNHQAIALAMRHQAVSPQRHYLDAKGNGQGFANQPYGRGQALDHIPDEIIMQMANPGMEMMQMGQQMGLESVIDHGAVGSLTKVFDAAPFISEYVEKLEGSLDYLARLLFMLFWKPKDFAKMFGTDDLPQLENKLTGVFVSYGDLVLELRQSAGDSK